MAVVHHDDRLMADVARENGTWLDQPGPRIGDLTWDALRLSMSEPRGPAAPTPWRIRC